MEKDSRIVKFALCALNCFEIPVAELLLVHLMELIENYVHSQKGRTI